MRFGAAGDNAQRKRQTGAVDQQFGDRTGFRGQLLVAEPGGQQRAGFRFGEDVHGHGTSTLGCDHAG
ncbi:hypothetical protein EV192_1021031 [Actinocrispum wychmicini]|uniref:Uncharacterized protein n=1 Tax=Actinocrispum wychmicini TaxID=1213861 RepID=A0A4R2JRK8_9PSEU|nr:hypothetical protein EV192_1021031 [Actinocrispum wychmicini]